MALSNIGNEPRREITEQTIGAVAVIAFVALSYHVGNWIKPFTDIGDAIFGTLVCAIFMFAAIMLTIPFLLLVHFIGEVLCGALAAVGADPRPRDRY